MNTIMISDESDLAHANQDAVEAALVYARKSGCPDELADILAMMIKSEPSKRCTAKVALALAKQSFPRDVVKDPSAILRQHFQGDSVEPSNTFKEYTSPIVDQKQMREHRMLLRQQKTAKIQEEKAAESARSFQESLERISPKTAKKASKTPAIKASKTPARRERQCTPPPSRSPAVVTDRGARTTARSRTAHSSSTPRAPSSSTGTTVAADTVVQESVPQSPTTLRLTKSDRTVVVRHRYLEGLVKQLHIAESELASIRNALKELIQQ